MRPCGGVNFRSSGRGSRTEGHIQVAADDEFEPGIPELYGVRVGILVRRSTRAVRGRPGWCFEALAWPRISHCRIRNQRRHSCSFKPDSSKSRRRHEYADAQPCGVHHDCRFDVVLTQSGCTYSVEPTSSTYDASGGAGSVVVTTTGLACTFTAASASPFLSTYGVILIAEYGPCGTMSMLWTFTISLVSGFRSALVTTSANSGSSPLALRRLSRSSLDGYPRM